MLKPEYELNSFYERFFTHLLYEALESEYTTAQSMDAPRFGAATMAFRQLRDRMLELRSRCLRDPGLRHRLQAYLVTG